MLGLERIRVFPESSYLRHFLEVTDSIAVNVSTNLNNITSPVLYIIANKYSTPHVCFPISLYKLVATQKPIMCLLSSQAIHSLNRLPLSYEGDWVLLFFQVL